MNAAVPIIDRATRAQPYSPNQAAYEAFSLGSDAKGSTRLCDPLEATTLAEALGEATSRWSWDRGDRLAIREITESGDHLHVYAVRRKAHGRRSSIIANLEYGRWLDHICTIDLHVIAGIPRGLVGGEVDLHERRQRLRPEGARR